jgi:hypothetical protein
MQLAATAGNAHVMQRQLIQLEAAAFKSKVFTELPDAEVSKTQAVAEFPGEPP